jgi:hypothetical protein
VHDPSARGATSGFARLSPAVVDRVIGDVRRDLASGAWDERHGDLRERHDFDSGLRLVTNAPDAKKSARA